MQEDSVYSHIAASDLHELPLYHLGLEWSAYDSLQQAGIETVGQLLKLSAKELAGIPGLTLEMHFQISNRLFSPVCDELRGSPLPVSAVALPDAAHDALIQSGVSTLGELSQMSYVGILALPGLDMRDVVRIRTRLREVASTRLPSVDSNDSRPSSVGSGEAGDEAPVREEERFADEESAEHEDADSPPCCPALVGDNTPIAALELSGRSHDALLKAGITTVGHLASTSIQGLRELRLIDAALSNQIQARLGQYEQDRPPPAQYPSALETASLASLELSDSTQRSLETEGIATLDQLARLSGEQLLNIRGIELDSVVEIREKLSAYRRGQSQSSPTTSGTSDAGSPAGPSGRASHKQGSMQLNADPPLEVLGLSTRAYNALRRAGYTTVAQIASLTEEQLLSIRQVGVGTLQEIKAKLRDYLNSCREPGEGSPSILRRQPVDTLDLSENTKTALAEEGFVTVGWLIHSLQIGELDAKRLGKEAMAEIESGLEEYLGHPPSVDQTRSASAEGGVESSLVASETKICAGKRVISRDTPIHALGLSTRIDNALSRAPVETVGQLMERLELEQLMEIRNIGQKSVADIKDALAQVQVVRQETRESEDMDDVGQKVVEVPVIASSIISWQASLIQKQIAAGLLHEHAKSGQASLSQLLSSVEGLDPAEAFETMAGIIGASFNVCDELEFLLDQIGRDDYITVLLSRYGYEAQTLEEIGTQIGVTRERVRQLGNRLEREIGTLAELEFRKLPGEAVGMPSFIRMQSALLIAEEMGLQITYNGWKRRIVTSGLVGRWTSQRYSEMDPIESMIAVCNLVADREISELTIPANLEYAIELGASGSPKTRAKIAQIRKNLSHETAKLVRRHARFSGAVHAGWLAQEIDRSRDQTAEILRALGYELVSGSWFAADPGDDEITGHDVFHHAVREMFQYCGPLSADDVCSGLRHYVCRTRFPVPPPEVMEEILPMYGYQLKDGLWYCDEETAEELSTGERIIKQCIEQHGPVVHHSQLTEAFIESELSFPSLHATLRRSPIFERIDKGLYKLRGTSVSHDDIRRAKSAAESVSVDPSVKYNKSGSVILSANLSAHTLGTGVITSQRFPNLSGEWDCFAGDKHFGEIEVADNQLRYLGKPLEHLGCQPEDRVRLIFNVWDRTVEIEKVQD